MQKGFSIIELLVVIVIIGLLSALALVGFRGKSSTDEFEKTIEDLATNLRTMQAWSLSNHLCNGEVTINFGARKTSGTAYELYCLPIADGASEYIMETINLPADIAITSGEVFFVSPYAERSLFSNYEDFVITGDAIKTIIIEENGKIKIQ